MKSSLFKNKNLSLFCAAVTAAMVAAGCGPLDRAVDLEPCTDASCEEDPSRLTDHELQEDAADAGPGQGVGSKTSALHNGYWPGNLFQESVGLRFTQGRTLGFCTGVQVSARYILTPGHCLDRFTVVPGFPATRTGTVSVRVRYSSASTGTITSYSGTASFTIHPSYLPGDVVDHDVALLHLDGDPSHAYRARLYSGGLPQPVNHYVAGWSQEGTTDQQKSYGYMTYVGATAISGLILMERNDQHTISGDSGSPYLVKQTTSTTTRYLTDGVHSRRSGPLMYGARTMSFIPWMLSAAISMGDALSCGSASINGASYLYGCN